jgi:hypothetical protein
MRPKLALQHAEDYEKKKKIVEHLRNIANYIKKNKIKRFILITDNASLHDALRDFWRIAGCIMPGCFDRYVLSTTMGMLKSPKHSAGILKN